MEGGACGGGHRGAGACGRGTGRGGTRAEERAEKRAELRAAWGALPGGKRPAADEDPSPTPGCWRGQAPTPRGCPGRLPALLPGRGLGAWPAGALGAGHGEAGAPPPLESCRFLTFPFVPTWERAGGLPALEKARRPGGGGTVYTAGLHVVNNPPVKTRTQRQGAWKTAAGTASQGGVAHLGVRGARPQEARLRGPWRGACSFPWVSSERICPAPGHP